LRQRVRDEAEAWLRFVFSGLGLASQRRTLRREPLSSTIPRLLSIVLNDEWPARRLMTHVFPVPLRGPADAGGAVRRILAALVILTLAVAAGAAAWIYWRARVCLSQLDGQIPVAGLQAPVSVVRDARGVPHIRAVTIEDLIFAQGYVTAQDRLWQMDLSRRLAGGELSEIFGERTLELDIENRTLGLHRVAERTLAEMDDETRRLFAAYARGVNAFIDSHAERLPIEFVILRYRPRTWSETDSIRVGLNMAKMLSTSWPEDLMRERVCAKVAPDLCADLFPDRTPLDRPVAEPVRPTRTGPDPTRTSLDTELREIDPAFRALLSRLANSSRGIGSNNWVVSGAHTQSGKPLLANDPHLGHGVPSVWYMAHLKAPGVNATGVTFPGLPSVIIGHNERIAWGVTNTGPDVQDLYVEKFDPGNPRQYLHNGNWVEAEIHSEVIKVRGKPDYPLAVKVTRHGPIISSANRRELALQWTLLKPRAFKLPFWSLNRVGNWEEFVAALRGFAVPMQNFVYADADGNIGYYAPGWIPIRKSGDGTIPVDGSTDKYDWIGLAPFEDLPHSYNPPRGLIVTANGRVVPDGYPYLITRMWAEPYRTARIFQLLETGDRFTVEEMLKAQSDIFAMHDKWLAQRIVAAAEKHPPRSSESQFAVETLKAWNGEARWVSPAPLITSAAERALLERLLRPKLGDDFASYSCPMTPVFVENVINNEWVRWLPSGDADFENTLMRSLEDGVRRIPQIAGSTDHVNWQWGETIPLTFRHPLGSLPLAGRLFNVGPFPQSGTGTTVKQTTSEIGPSMRMVIDFGNLDHSVQNITLGQSGQVSSPYYRDQVRSWYEGESFPMPFSDAEVERNAVHRLVLQPGG
jgi:penicillin amidase